MIRLVVFYKRIKFIFYEKDSKLTKNNIFNNVLCCEIAFLN